MTTIITKNSSTASAVPLAADLVQGELAVNVTDKRLFTQNASDVVVELGTNPSSITTASATITGGTVNNTSVGASTPSTGAFTALSATGLTTTNGQVKFPSSQNASADANTLDDYEEGAWTPTLTGTNLTGLSWGAGYYTKVGRLVTLNGYLNCTVTSSNTLTYVSMGGIPFAASLSTAGGAFLNNNVRIGSSQVTGTSAYAFFSAASAPVSGAEVIQFSISYTV